MKIAVVGAGAMGCLFGGKLSALADVWLIDLWAEHVAAMQTRGLQLIEPDGAEQNICVRAVSDIKQVADAIDLALIFVKSNRTEWAARQAAQMLAPDGLALTLQNGLGNLDVIAKIVGDARAVQGVTAHGATLLGPGHVRHAGVGATHLATRAAIATRVENIARLFNDAGFETHLSDNLDSLVWGKLVVNVGINALTAILRVPNSALDEVPAARTLLERAVNEAVAVANAKQITLPYGDAIAQVLNVARATGSNHSSMLQDVLRGAATEIDVINGAIVREGERVGVATPVNRTLTELVQAIEASYNIHVNS
jgi:2-dehydropantoate 2-reductase